MENITFYEQINLFLENKRPRKPSAYVCRFDARVLRHELAHATKVRGTIKDQFLYINVEVWNESHIIWEPFQTSIFSLYKALHGIFQKHTENPKGEPKIH